ncbi:type II secretion system protein [Selenomonas sp.]|uniref:type II secretion system protein n=1 Tax=Selenomonas sp. TaxID=2053611 RepID=UPI003FA2D015
MKEAGFTLLEILLVCLVLALIAALSLPVVRATERVRLEREAAFLAGNFRYLQEISRTERTPDGKGEWRVRPKLVVEAHRCYFLFPEVQGEQMVHDFPEDIAAAPRTLSPQKATAYYFYASGDPGGESALGQSVELQSLHYSLDVIIDEAGRVRTESRWLP